MVGSVVHTDSQALHIEKLRFALEQLSELAFSSENDGAMVGLLSPFYGIMEFFENRELDKDNEIH